MNCWLQVVNETILRHEGESIVLLYTLKVPRFSQTAFSFLGYIYKIRRSTFILAFREAGGDAHKHVFALKGPWRQQQYLSVALESNSSTYGSFLNLSVPTAT